MWPYEKTKLIIIVEAIIMMLMITLIVHLSISCSNEKGKEARSYVEISTFVTEGEYYEYGSEFGYYAKTEEITRNKYKTFIYYFSSELNLLDGIKYTIKPIFQGYYITEKGVKTYLSKKQII